MPVSHGGAWLQWPPFALNSRCYTCFLVMNATPNRWRQRYNEDTDMTLQVLADGRCTVLFNAFLINTPETMTASGGQTDIYKHDGRLDDGARAGARGPGVATTIKRYGRPAAKLPERLAEVRHAAFIRGADIDFASLPKIDERGMELRGVAEIRSPALQDLVRDSRRRA